MRRKMYIIIGKHMCTNAQANEHNYRQAHVHKCVDKCICRQADDNKCVSKFTYRQAGVYKCVDKCTYRQADVYKCVDNLHIGKHMCTNV